MRSSQAKKAKSPAPGILGIIGGSGLYEMPGLTAIREVRVRTPFGDPSDAFVTGILEGRRVAFLARHGRGHRLLPSELNFRANIYALKLLGAERILSVSAVGSLREALEPGHFLVPDQFFDRTKHRMDTFFGGGIVAHISFDRPTCPHLSGVLADAADAAGVKVHRGGTYVCIEGPQFSTRAESHVFRQLHFDIIGMTNVTEARLAREAEICYATLAMITDYDCWHPQHDSVTAAQVIECLVRNADNARRVVRAAVAAMPAARDCKCGQALAHAIFTDRKLMPAAAKKRLAAILGSHLS
ncbi:MAG: S-methyl-5'-thioadenosine phosphorylase [Acidipila sp.]|nr:S-methyl-5'-thioadenosine phosphorylase [Acidipila sp.]